MTNPTPKKSMSATNQVLIGLGVGCGCLGMIFIGGILLAIALPSFLNQSLKARESEGKAYVGMMTRAQQAYFLENEKFAGSLSELAVSGSTTETSSYTYSMTSIPGPKPMVSITARPKANKRLRGFVGAARVIPKTATTAVSTESLVCKSATPGSLPATFQNIPGPLTCPGTMVSVSE